MYKKLLYNIDDYSTSVELTDKIIEDLQEFSSCFTVTKVTNLGGGSTSMPAIEFKPSHEDIVNRFTFRFSITGTYFQWYFYKAPLTTSNLRSSNTSYASLQALEIYTNDDTKDFLIIINNSYYSFGVFETENGQHYWLIPDGYFYVNDLQYGSATFNEYLYPISEETVIMTNILLSYNGLPCTYPFKNCYKCILNRNIPMGQRCLINNDEYVEMYPNTSTTRCNLFKYTT